VYAHVCVRICFWFVALQAQTGGRHLCMCKTCTCRLVRMSVSEDHPRIVDQKAGWHKQLYSWQP